MCRPEDFPPYEPDLKDFQAPAMPDDIPEADEVIRALDQMSEEWVTSEEERVAFHAADVLLVGHLIRAVKKSQREWYEDGMKMLALDIKAKTDEIERLTDELSGCNSGVLDLQAGIARYRQIEEAAREWFAAFRDWERDHETTVAHIAASKRVTAATNALRAALKAER